MIIFNPTQDVVVAKHDGATYLFRGGEEKLILNEYAAKHILNRWAKYGLVDLTYNEKMQKLHSTPYVFRHKKRIEGVEVFLETLHRKLDNFKIYEEACGDKITPERRKMSAEKSILMEQIKKVKSHLASINSITEQDLVDIEIKELEKSIQQAKEKQNRLARSTKPNGTDAGRNQNIGSV